MVGTEICNNVPLSIVERHCDFGPVIYDLDFKYSLERSKEIEGNGRIYDDAFLKLFISKVYMELTQYLNLHDVTDANHCYVLTKKNLQLILKNVYVKMDYIFFPRILKHIQIFNFIFVKNL